MWCVRCQIPNWLHKISTRRNPANIYLFKVSNRKVRKKCKMCWNLTIKIPKWSHWQGSFLKRQASGTSSENEWQRVTTSGIANNNKWQRIAVCRKKSTDDPREESITEDSKRILSLRTIKRIYHWNLKRTLKGPSGAWGP